MSWFAARTSTTQRSTCDSHNSKFVMNSGTHQEVKVSKAYSPVVKSLLVYINAIKDRPRPTNVHKLDKCAHERSGGVPMARPNH